MDRDRFAAHLQLQLHPLNGGAPATRHWPMKIHKPPERPVGRFDIDHGVSDPPPPPRWQSNAQQGHGYWWNATTQELIPILPEDHPDYRQNAEIIAAAMRRWNGGTSR
jgi:hypothetical protein